MKFCEDPESSSAVVLIVWLMVISIVVKEWSRVTELRRPASRISGGEAGDRFLAILGSFVLDGLLSRSRDRG